MNRMSARQTMEIGELAHSFITELENAGIYDLHFNFSVMHRRGLAYWDIIDTLDGQNTRYNLTTEEVWKFIEEERPGWE